MPKLNLLSVDFDYFFPIFPYSESDSDNPSDWMLYDWGQSDSQNILLSNFLWEVRASTFLRVLEYLPPTSGEEKNFWDKFKFSKDAKLYICDNHGAGAELFDEELYELTRYDEIWNFDMHHDCGYTSVEHDEAVVESYNCGSWLLGFGLNGHTKIHIRYPSWADFQLDHDIPFNFTPESRKVFMGKDKLPVFTDVLLARSPQWTASWIDKSFWEFLENCPVKNIEYLEEVPVREFDIGNVDKLMTAESKIMEGM